MHDEIRPAMSQPIDDHEGGMARSELYRAAKYSMKLFQMIEDGQDLEGWVQAKITKSADYLDSVYHYMEYQVKFGDGSHASNIDDITGDAEKELPDDEPVSDMDDEERKIDEMTAYEQKLQALLEGAVKKAVKGKKAEDKKDELDEASGVRATDKKKGKVDKSERKQYFVKLEKDNKTRGVTTVADEGERESEVRDRMKRDNPGWTVASIRVKDEIDEAAEKIAKAEKAAKNKKEKDAMIKEALSQVVEKAVSKAQQKFMGMVHAAKKGEKPASKEVEKAAKGMSKKSAEDFASTKHKGLPEKKKKMDEKFMPSERDPGKKPPVGGVAGAVGDAVKKAGEVVGKGMRKVGDNVIDKNKPFAKSMNKPDEDDIYTNRAKAGKYKSEIELNTPEPVKEMSPPDGATAAPKKDPKTGKYPKITSGPNKGKEWSQEKPGPTNPNFKEGKGSKPDFLDMDKDGDKKEPMKKAVADKKKGAVKEDQDLIKSIVRKVVAEKQKNSAANNALKGAAGAAALYFGAKTVQQAARNADNNAKAKKDAEEKAKADAAVDPNAPKSSVNESINLSRLRILSGLK